MASSAKFTNNTSRLRKWICECEYHAIDAESGTLRPGPYIIRTAGDALIARCELCGSYFKATDEPATRKLYRGCAHCTNPDAHDHGMLDAASLTIRSIIPRPLPSIPAISDPYHPHASFIPCGPDCIE